MDQEKKRDKNTGTTSSGDEVPKKERVGDLGMFLWVKVNDKVTHTTGMASRADYGRSPSWDENIEWYPFFILF
jgi:hypothetical protein